MKVIYAFLAGFYPTAALREGLFGDPENKSKNDPPRSSARSPIRLPLAVEHQGRILDVSALAEERGVRPRQKISHARKSAPDLRVVEYQAGHYQAYAEAWYEQGCRFSPRVEPDGERALWLELAVNEAAYPVACELEKAAVPLLGEHLFIGEGSNPFLAKSAALLARLGPEAAFLVKALGKEGALRSQTLPLGGSCLSIPPGREAAFLARLPLALLWPLPVPRREELRRLGVRTAGQVARLDEKVLYRRFGSFAHVLIHYARGRDPEHGRVRALYPPREVRRQSRFQGGVSDRQALELSLRRLAGEVAAELIDRGEGCRLLFLRAEAEEGRLLQVRRSLARPRAAAPELESLARQLLRGLQEKAGPTAWLRLELVARHLAASPAGQLNLWEVAASRQEPVARDAWRQKTVRRVMGHLEARYRRPMVRWGSQLAPSRREILLGYWDPFRFRREGRPH